METVRRANLKNQNDILGMLLELATVEALKSIPLYVVRTSQFNEYYQQDRSKGPDIIFEMEDKSAAIVECKNLNMDFIVSENWFKDKVEGRFINFKGLEMRNHFLVISQFKTSPPELAIKIRDQGYRIFSVGFQITDEESYYNAIPIIAQKFKFTLLARKEPKNSSK